LKFFVKGNAVPYEGGRTEKEIIQWIDKRTLPSTKTASSDEDLKSIIENNEVVVVFWGDEHNSHFTEFDITSKSFEDMVFAVAHPEWKASHNAHENDVVTLYKKFDERQASFEGEVHFRNL